MLTAFHSKNIFRGWYVLTMLTFDL